MTGFFQTFDSPRVKLMPRVEDTFELYKNTLIAMVAVFQIPTLALFLAKMHMVTARFLWRNVHYAILLISSPRPRSRRRRIRGTRSSSPRR